MRVPVTGILIDASKFNTSIQVDEQRYSGSFIFRVVSSLSPMIEGYDNIEFLFSQGQSNDIETLRNIQNSAQGNVILWEAHGIFKARGTGNKPHQLELVSLYLIDQLTGEQYNSIMKLIPLPVEQPIFQGMRESPPPQQIAPPFPKQGALQAQQIAPPLPKQQAFYPQVLIPANPRGPPGIINSYKPDPNANTGY
ncbi:MAG: hypothetical protein EZS28_043840 [Streblomastix strix]|uniref:Uncharacterized protein n=1 Tax=Streblomastix strix TaxID=222440 RepID=A0A5J4TRV3_9EUKA|nr:MAG: hypothetical protein EZS28_043840 [Streblomastix strix]